MYVFAVILKKTRFLISMQLDALGRGEKGEATMLPIILVHRMLLSRGVNVFVFEQVTLSVPSSSHSFRVVD